MCLSVCVCVYVVYVFELVCMWCMCLSVCVVCVFECLWCVLEKSKHGLGYLEGQFSSFLILTK